MGEAYRFECADETIAGKFMGFRYDRKCKKRGGLLLRVMKGRRVALIWSRDIERIGRE